MISTGEIKFFEQIKDRCKVIFDIGCRTDIHYLLLHPNAEFHLFEPNETFFNTIKEMLQPRNYNVKINNFGLGATNEQLLYYENTQSFIKRTTHTTSDPTTAKLCVIKKFSEYITENDIKHIDFLKMDVEGYEPDIIFDAVDFIKANVKWVQFEYASTWLDKPHQYDLNLIWETFSEHFKFYYIYDENHPICKDKIDTLFEIKRETIAVIDTFMKDAYGFNIIMEKISHE